MNPLNVYIWLEKILWRGFGLENLQIPFYSAVLFGVPLSVAFFRALRLARDPQIRVAIRPPWSLFRIVAAGALIRWALLWLPGLIAMHWIYFHMPYMGPTGESRSHAAWIPALLAGPLLFLVATLIWAPRLRGVKAIYLVGMGHVLAALPLALILSVRLEFLQSRSKLVADRMITQTSVHTGLLLIALILLGLAAVYVWHKGDSWFRFEE